MERPNVDPTIIDCKPGTVLNPLTYVCTDLNSKQGRLISEVLRRPEAEIRNCPPRTYRDPVSNTCRGEHTNLGALIKAVLDNKGVTIRCPPRFVFNRESGRCNLAAGAKGKEIVGPYSCYAYPPRDPNVKFVPKPYQEQVATNFIEGDEKGILLLWALGTGKTIGSILASDRYLQVSGEIVTNNGIVRPRYIYVLSSGSLRENFISQYCMLAGQDRNRISTNFRFLSYNYTRLKDRLPSYNEIEDSLIIIDEVHNLIRGYLNQSENLVPLYELLTSLKRSRFILLTGTPIVSKIEELYYMSKLLRPTAFNSKEDFLSFFRPGNQGYPVPYAELYDQLYGVISRVDLTPTDPNLFPTVYSFPAFAVMGTEQFEDYNRMREIESKAYPPQERLRVTDPAKFKRQSTKYYLATSMLRSRQRCNMVYPENIRQYIEEGTALPDHLTNDRIRGWITPEFIENISYYSPKFEILLRLIQSIPGKHVVYSQYKVRYGVFMIDALLRYYGYRTLLFTGDLNDEQRRSIIERFNNVNNLNGELYRVLLITDAGSEGQNFLQVRALHIMEQYINEFSTQQVVGRVVRLNSHLALPVNQRNVIIYYYFALTPGELIEQDPNLGPTHRLQAARLRQYVPSDRYTSDFLAYFRAIEKAASLAPTLELLLSYPVLVEPGPAPPVSPVVNPVVSPVISPGQRPVMRPIVPPPIIPPASTQLIPRRGPVPPINIGRTSNLVIS